MMVIKKTLACKGCSGLWIAIIEKDNSLEYYPKSVAADFTEEGEIPILESEQVSFVKDTYIDMRTEVSDPQLKHGGLFNTAAKPIG